MHKAIASIAVAIALIVARGQTPRAMQHSRAASSAVAGIGPGSFTWIGPESMGGDVSSLAIDPSNPSKIFASTPVGLWRSLDGGANWSRVATFGDSTVNVVVVNPADPSIVYAGMTGPLALWKSTDGGDTWTGLPPPNGAAWGSVSTLHISADGSTLLARDGAVWRSTDGAATWTLTLSFPSPRIPVVVDDVAFVEGGLGAIALVEGLSSTGAWYSSDGGVSWHASQGLPTLDYTEAIGTDASSGLVYVVNGLSIFRSTDGGATFTRRGAVFLAGRGSIWIDPADGDHLLVGLSDLLESTDAGATFTQVSNDSLPESLGYGINAIVPHPAFDGTTNRRLYFATLTGVFRADDISALDASGAGYTPLNHGLNVAYVDSAAGIAASGTVLANTPLGIARHRAGTSTEEWTRLGSESKRAVSGTLLPDPSGASVFFDRDGRLYRSDSDGAAPAEPIDGTYWNGSTYVCKQPPYVLNCGGAGYIDRTLVDPAHANTLVVVIHTATGAIWRTTNANAAVTETTGPVWQQISPPPAFGAVDDVALGGNGVMWAGGYGAGGVWRLARTTNTLSNQPDWIDVTPPATGYPDSPMIITVDAVAPGTALLRLGGAVSEAFTSLWRTVDGGTSWTRLPLTGPDAFPSGTWITTLVTHPTAGGWLYAGTSNGLYSSDDDGDTWRAAADALGHGSVQGLSWMGRQLVVTAAYRGVFVSARPLDRSRISVDTPAPGSTTAAPLTISGWAISESALSGTGVDAVHVYAVPTGGAAVFLGAAAYGAARPEIGALFGSQFTNSGYELTTGAALPAGSYTILVFAHNATTGTFDASASAGITIAAPTGNPQIGVDTPAANQIVTSSFEIGGWLLDANAPSGTGVDDVKIYVQLPGAPAPGVFIGHGRLGLSRPDVGAIYGSRFNNAGFHFTITGLSPGPATLWVIGHSTVTSSDSISKAVPYTVSATGLMSVDVPTSESIITANTFSVGGWAILSSTVGSEAWNSRDLKSRPH